MRFNYLLGHVGDATEIVIVKEPALLFSVRVNFSGQGFVRLKFKADENLLLLLWPPYCLLVVHPSPFPGDCGKGGGRGSEYMTPSL